MRQQDVGHAGHGKTIHPRRVLALALGLLACALPAFLPALASASSTVGITSVIPSPLAVGDTNVTGKVVITNNNTPPDGSTTICNFNDTGSCAGVQGITLIPSCSVPDASGCSFSGRDPNVFAINPTAVGAVGSACVGQVFNVTVADATYGTVRFTPASGHLVLSAPGSSCHIAYTFDVLKLPADAQVATAGLQTRQRVMVSAVSDQDETTGSNSSGTVTVKLAAPAVTDSDPDSPASDNLPKVKGTAMAGATQVTLYDHADCTGASTTGTPGTFASPGLSLSVPNDSTTTFAATVTDSQGGVSACSTTTYTYIEDSTPPDEPVPNDTNPQSPANDNSPRIKGTAAADATTVRLYTNATCTSAIAASGTPAAFASPGLSVSVANNTTTTYYATAADAAGNVSSCSSASENYIEDSAPPAAPVPGSTNPPSPSNVNTPRIVGTAETGSTVKIYTNASCTGSPAGTGSAAAFTLLGIEATVSDNSMTTFYATATDAAGNVSACSAPITYVEDSTPPGVPSLTGMSPASPANENSPRVVGTSLGGTTVRLYKDAACDGALAGEGSAAGFASPGILVSVADNSSTTFYARSVDTAGNATGCSPSSVTYVEDSTSPETSIDGGPADTGASATPTFTFSSTDPGVTFECRLDAAGDFVRCTSPYTTPALSAGAHTFEVRSVDAAGNPDATSAVRTFTVGSAAAPPPPPPAATPPPPPPAITKRPQPGCVGITGSIFVGTKSNNIRNGGKATDIMFGQGGNDTLRGTGGVDCLYGEDGNDTLVGGIGGDRLFGGSGKDRLDGQAGNDQLSGSFGNDRLAGGAGNDRLVAGGGNDNLVDRSGADRFSGGAGKDRIDARDSKRADRRKPDRILCGKGKDIVFADPKDIVSKDCERSGLKRRSLP